MAEDECMGMTVWAMLSSELGLVLLVVANFDESQKSELKTRTRAKLGLGMPKLEVNAPRREAHRSTNACQESVFPSSATKAYGSFSGHVQEKMFLIMLN